MDEQEMVVVTTGGTGSLVLWAAVVSGIVAITVLVVAQVWQSRRERENWRRERVYEVAKDVTNVVASVHYQEPVPEPAKIVEMLRPQFILLYSLVPNFAEIDQDNAIDRFIDGDGVTRDGIVREVEAMMQVVVNELHARKKIFGRFRKKSVLANRPESECAENG